MDALTTATRVLAWAEESVGLPPAGPLYRPGPLTAPDVEPLRRLAAAAAARLGAGHPPLGDAGAIGLGALLIAAAVGGRADERTAAAIIDAVPAIRLTATGGWAEAVVRHAVVGPVLALPGAGGFTPALAEPALRASPLTAVLHRPLPGAVAATRATAARLLRRPRGASVITAALAAPSTDADVLDWRSELLELLRQQHTSVALDVYVTARLWHGPAWDERIRWARRELSGLGAQPELPIATIRYWAPLARLYRDEQAQATLTRRIEAGPARTVHKGESIAARIFLKPEDFLPAVRLVHRYRLLPAGAS